MWSWLPLVALVACAASPPAAPLHPIATPRVISAKRPLPRIIELVEHSDVEVIRGEPTTHAPIVILGIKVEDPKLASELGPVALAITADIRTRVRDKPGMFDLAGEPDHDLADLELGAGCNSAQLPCALQIASGFSTRFVMFGTIRRYGRTSQASLELRLIDVEKQFVARSSYSAIFERAPANSAVYAFDDLSREQTTIAIKVNVDKPTLKIDGRHYPFQRFVKGELKLKAPPGKKHTLLIESLGYESVTLPLDYTPGETQLIFNLIPCCEPTSATR